ncbi:Zinc finger, RING/FYVE/PHD-type [Cynara cardunculus var. scolymus]|uniref:Zinc finger, RING/FYVE/PHD-type n=1 Tax=Cynara cardunculus var. scolymus TaxID=59895 RepID=A0A118JV84_CYNCS|nr:Zinc finger, RING/FYVE/PHD-type [Cynara cardunculus var. scolymus]
MDPDDSGVMDLTRNIMLVSIAALFILTLFFLFLHLYSKWYSYRLRQTAIPDPQQRPLDASFLKIIQFHPNDFQHGLECAICLSQLQQGDKARILPKCNHGFHMECIDMWFHSHSTCPICRDQVSQQHSPTHDVTNHHQEEPASSSLHDRRIRPDLVIDIPAALSNQEEEEQQQQQQLSNRCSSGMRSLKKIFSPGTSSGSNVKSCPLTP